MDHRVNIGFPFKVFKKYKISSPTARGATYAVLVSVLCFVLVVVVVAMCDIGHDVATLLHFRLLLMRRSHQARSVTSATIDQSQLIVTLF